MKRYRSRPPSLATPSAPRSEEVATLRIDNIAAGGAGVGRIDGLTCFVPRTARGDLAQVAYINHGRYARGRVLQLLESSGERTTPRCVHYERDDCGGCQLQHLSGEAQRATRQQIVRDAITRVGQRDVALPELISGSEWAYRHRLTLTLRPKGSSWTGGLVPQTHGKPVFTLDECPISHPVLVAAWLSLRGHLRGLPDISRSSNALRLSLRMSGEQLDRVAVVIIGARQWPDGEAWAAQALQASPSISSIWWEPEGREAVCLGGSDDREVLAFAQVNPPIALALRQHVAEVVRAALPRTVVDAYAGRGELSELLARAGVQVSAIEADSAATARATERLAGFAGSTVLTAMVEDVINDVLPADIVVLNPPRRGLDPRVTSALADSAARGVKRIVYVSCDPATLARDLSRMPRWRVESVRCYDMFPQTAHVETVCVLVPEKS